MNKTLDMEAKIISFLQKHQGEAFLATEISLGVGFPKGKNTASKVNPSLYKLQKEGKVARYTKESGKPYWCLT